MSGSFNSEASGGQSYNLQMLFKTHCSHERRGIASTSYTNKYKEC